MNFCQQKSTHFHTARLPTWMHQEGSGATSDPAQGSPKQSRETLSLFNSAGSEGSSNDLKSQNQATWKRNTPAGPATRGGSSLPATPRPHLRRLHRGRPGAATLRRSPLAGASGVAGLGRSRWAWDMSGQRRIATVWAPRCPLCRLGAAPRTSAGRCRCLASRLLGPPRRAARRLRAHAREGALASRQHRAPRPSPPPAPRSRPFSLGQSAPRRGC